MYPPSPSEFSMNNGDDSGSITRFSNYLTTNSITNRSGDDGSGSKSSIGARSDGGTLDSSTGAVWSIDPKDIEIGDLIASGSFGMVHSGTYRGKTIAIKFLLFPDGISEDESFKAKRGFRKEVSVWHKLNHPNVVEFLGAYIQPPKWAIVTEYLEGGSVKAFLSRQNKKRLPIPTIASMALDIARGMEYLHSNNVIHRDIKSANMLLDNEGRVKVADFGLARSESLEPGNMTAETGTIRWMAPEMIDHKPYTRKVDVYSFGIVLWELCTCQWPFEGFSFVQLAYAIVNDNVRPNTRDIHPAFVKMMTTCWDPNPDVRPDFGNIVRQLESLLNSLSSTFTKNPTAKVNDASINGRKSVSFGGADDGWKAAPDVVYTETKSRSSPSGGCGCTIT